MTDRDIFLQARELPPERRAEFVRRACGEDGERCARVLELLAEWAGGASALGVWAAGGSHGAGDAARLPPADPLEVLRGYFRPSERPDGIGRLGQYEVLGALGAGAFGIVLRAFDDVLHRVVAIKVLYPELARTSPPRKRFVREARAGAAVRHEHVVQIYAVHEEPLPHLVMEYVEGESLQARMDATGPLPPPEVARLGRQIALGLAAAHERGLVHRDVKPANLLLTRDVEPAVKLTDFGLARTADAASLTQSGVIAGTPLYMAPEQVRGEPVDARSDLFSLGSVLYALCAGHPPFRAPTTFAVLKRVAEDTPRPIRDVMPEVPAGLTAVVDRLLEKRPERRFQTGREVAAALEHCLAVPPLRRRHYAGRVAVAVVAAVVVVAAVLQGLVRQPDPPVTSRPAADLTPAEPILRKQLTGHRAFISGLAFSPDGRLLAGGGLGTLCVWDMPAGTLRYALTVPADKSFTAVTFSPDGRTLVTAPDVENGSAPIDLYDAETGMPTGRLEGHERGLFGLSFEADGNTLVSSGWEGELRFWDVARRELLRTRPTPNGRWIRASVHSVRGQLAVGSGQVYVFDTRGELVRTFDVNAAPLAFSPDGRLVIGSVWREGVATLWDVVAGEAVASWKAHDGLINGVTFSPGGKVLATAGEGGVHLWDTATRRRIGELPYPGEAYAVAFAPDRRHLVTTGRDTVVKLWDVSGLLAEDGPAR